MKRSLIYIVCAIMFLSCHQVSEQLDDSQAVPALESDEVAFTMGITTKGEVIDQSNLHNQKFKVYGYHTGSDKFIKALISNSSLPSNLFAGTVAQYSDNQWNYWGDGEPREWERYEYHSFFAIMPSDAATLINTLNAQNYIEGSPKFEYTTSSKLSDHKDLTFATRLDIIPTYVNGYMVPLNFKHVLSKVRFSVNVKEPSVPFEEPFVRVEVESLEILNIYNKANIIYSGTDFSTPFWSDLSDLSNLSWSKAAGDAANGFEWVITSPLAPEGTEGTVSQSTFFPEDRYAMLIPQNLTGAVLRLNCKYILRATGGEEVIIPHTIDNPLEDSWKMGVGYHYVINLDPSYEQGDLDLEIVMTDWNDVPITENIDGGEFTIVRDSNTQEGNIFKWSEVSDDAVSLTINVINTFPSDAITIETMNASSSAYLSDDAILYDSGSTAVGVDRASDEIYVNINSGDINRTVTIRIVQ